MTDWLEQQRREFDERMEGSRRRRRYSMIFGVLGVGLSLVAIALSVIALAWRYLP